MGKIKLFCKECEQELTLKNFCNLKDCDCSRIGRYCKKCGEIVYNKLFQERFVEKYNECKIFHKNNLYYPYWECLYSFEKLEDCKKRIDCKNIAIANLSLMRFIGNI